MVRRHRRPEKSLAEAYERLSSPTVTGVISGRVPTLDGLRAISITLVLLGHLSGTRNFPSRLAFFGLFANFGVRVFFVISGFLITGLLLKELGKTGKISLRDFYVRRVLRIFPAFYCYAFVITALAALSFIQLRHYDLLCAYTYTINFHIPHAWYVGHLWSLAVEEQFYLLWPATLALFSHRRAFQVAATVFLAGPVIRLGIWYLLPAWRGGIGHVFPTIADALAIGCLLAGWRDELHKINWYMKLLQPRAFVLIATLGALANLTQDRPRISYAVGQSLMNLSIALCVDRCITYYKGRFGRLLEWKPIAFVGVLSYSLYIWQQPFLNRASGSILAMFPINILLVGVAAAGSYFIIEQPFLRLKTKFAGQRSPSLKVVSSAPAGAHSV